MQALERAVTWTATALKVDFGPQAKGRIGINEIDVVVADALLVTVEARGAERRMTGCPEKQLHVEWHCLFGKGTVSRSSFHSVEQQGWRDDQDSWVT